MRISGWRNAYSVRGVNRTWSTSSALTSPSSTGSTASAVSSSGVKRDPTTAAAFSARLAAGSRRSIRAAMAACNVGGTVTSAMFVRDV